MALRKWIIGLTSLLCWYTPHSFANNFNYNFLEVRAAASPQSLGAEFSTYILENFHVVGRIDKQSNDAFDLAGGVGFNGPFGEFMDLYGQMLIHYTQEEADSSKDEGAMLELNVGSRVWLSENIEVHGKLGSISDHGLIEAGVRFHSTQQLSIGVEIRNNGLWGPQTTLDVRFEF